MRLLISALVATVLSLGVAGAAGINVPGGFGTSGVGDVVSPPLDGIDIELMPDVVTPEISMLDSVRITLDRGIAGSDPFDTTGGDCTGGPGVRDCYDVYMQLRNAAGAVLSTPKVVHNFGNGINGSPKSSDVSFFGEGVAIAEIDSVDITICGRYVVGGSEFLCRTPP